ncbi:MAG TPA: aldehyde dehydrogenase family protein, partial [Dongiaceae bacterium]|nr:aldehyde dehydrogenase family protein [Dongiaceae bacterium]
MATVQKTITPIDNSVYVERPYASAAEISATLKRAAEAQTAWKHTPIAERAKMLGKAVDIFLTHKDEYAEQITRQMGRPISQSPGEMRGFEERGRYMIQIA